MLAFVLGLNLAIVLTRIRGPLRAVADTVATLPLGVSAVTLGFDLAGGLAGFLTIGGFLTTLGGFLTTLQFLLGAID